MPLQLFGCGRRDWSTKLTRGLNTEAATGFQSRRGSRRDPTTVTHQHAPFATYKAAGVHRRARGRWHGRPPRSAQQTAVPLIGVLSSRSFGDSLDMLAAFRQGLRELGFFEHENVAIELA